MLSNASVRIVPDQIVFQGTIPGNSETTEIWVHNISKNPIKLRYSVPEDSNFTITSQKNVMLVSGLENKIKLKYFCQDNDLIEEELSIIAEDSVIKVPIIAYPPSARVNVDKTKIELGNVQIGAEIKEKIVISNMGTKNGSFTARCNDMNVMLTNATSKLVVGQYVNVGIRYTPKVSGPFAFKIEIKFTDSFDVIEPILVTGTAISIIPTIHIGGEEKKEVDFGKIFFGQKKLVNVFIANNSNAKKYFVISQPIENKTNAKFSTAKASTGSKCESVFSISPCEGILNPREKASITVVFEPPHNLKSNEVMYNYMASIRLEGCEQKSTFYLTGSAVPMDVYVPQIDFNFETQKVLTRTEKTLTITNKSHFLPIDYSYKPSSAYKVSSESGVVLPNKTKKITITFYPRNLGTFKSTSFISFCGGILKRKVILSGTSVSSQTEIERKSFRRVPVWESSETCAYNVRHPSKYGLSMDEIKKKEKQKENNRKIIVESAAKRSTVMQKKVVTERYTRLGKEKGFDDDKLKEFVKERVRKVIKGEDDVKSFGFSHAEGLEEPEAHIPRAAPLVIDHPEKYNIVSNKVKTLANKVLMSSDVTIKQKFKSKPTTPSEFSECARVLTPVQQMNIMRTKGTIDFGRISARSKMTKSFNVTNTLNQYIIVALTIVSPQLKESTPLSQVIPPKQTAGFDIVFYSENIGPYEATVTYTINGTHNFSFQVTAEVTPIEIELSTTEINFTFPDDAVTPYIKESVQITNKSNAVVEYRWTGFNTIFAIDKDNGVLQPLETIEDVITFTPGPRNLSETTAVISYTGGRTINLSMVGNCKDPKYKIDKKKINLGITAIGQEKEFSIVISNVGRSAAIYEVVSLSGDNICRCLEKNGSLKPGMYREIKFSFKSTQAGNYSFTYIIDVAGAESTKINVTAESLVPQLKITSDQLDFGRIFIGSNEAKKITIKNIGCIPAVFVIDLTKNKMFHLEYSSELMMSAEKNTNSIFCTQPNADNCSIVSSYESCEYRIKIYPKTTIEMHLVFKPTALGDFSFEMPFTLVGLTYTIVLLSPKISAESMHTPLFLSETYFDFGIATLRDTKNPNCRPLYKQVTLQNEHSSSIKYRFGEPISQDKGVFSVDEDKGDIIYSGTAERFFSFSPTRIGPFFCIIPVYVMIDGNEYKVASVQITGVGTSRLFKTSVLSVALPIVPLSVKSECTIDVLNSASIESTITIKKAINEKHFPLEITWPEGNKMKYSTVSLPLKISFCSPRPLSFTTRIALVSDKGATYSFTVYAATDNSALTLYPFLSLNRYEITSGPQSPLMCVPMNNKIRGDLIETYLSTEDVLSIRKTPHLLTDTLKDFLLYFLNNFVLSYPLTSFPGELCTEEGKPIQEMIENICANKKQTGLENIFKTKSTNPLQQKIEKMKSMITFLKSTGAVLPTILPEFLLDRESFISFMQNKITNDILDLNYYGAPSINSFDKKLLNSFSSTSSFSEALISRLRAVDSLYQQLNEEAWLIVVLQVLKVYLFSTVRAEEFNSTPGVNEAILSLKNILPNDVLSEINRNFRDICSSNVFSPIEGTLLKWATIHYDFMNPSKLAIITSFKQFTDARILAALVKSHVTRAPMDLILNPETQEDFDHNLKMLITNFNILHLNLNADIELIREGNIAGMILFIFQLYQILPHYVSSGSIEFFTQLSTSVTKSFEITNPSPAKLRYKGIITGSNNFKCVNSSIVVQPHQTVSYMIEYFARSHISEVATITLTPYPNKPATSTESLYTSTKSLSPVKAPVLATTIVLDLVSNVDPTVPISTTEIEGATYGITKFEIPIKNVLGCQGEYTVYSRYFEEVNHQGKVINEDSTIESKLREFIDNPNNPPETKPAKNSFDALIAEHQPFVFMSNEIIFNGEENETVLKGEFIPIGIGSYRCYILLKSIDGDEFLYEVKGTATLPIEEEDSRIFFKTEVLQKDSDHLFIEMLNQRLCKALAYSIIRASSYQSFITETKFDEYITFKSGEIANIYNRCIKELNFSITCSSPQFFKINDSFHVTLDNCKIPVEFAPTKPGNYSAKVVINSASDFRVFKMSGIGLGETKNISVQINTFIGKKIEQCIPINNPSKETWHYRISITKNHKDVFTVQKNLSVQGGVTAQLPVSVYTTEIGEYSEELTVFNMTKEVKTIYTINANVTDPPALDKLIINCKARKKHIEELILPEFIENGEAEIESTSCFITTKNKMTYKDRKAVGTLPLEIYVPMSGRTLGKLIIRDTNTNLYMWYVVELNVDVPDPEATICVTGQSRESVTISIPMNNDSGHELKFQVILSNDDLFGAKEFIASPLATSVYNIIFSPVKSFQRKSIVQFISEEAGEYIYVLDINVTSPETRILAQLSAPVGCTDSSFIPLNNMLDKTVNFTVDNSLPACFTVMVKRSFLLKPKEKKNIEIRFCASSVGIKETAQITFSSKDLGDFYYQITGIGKPPLPLSPVCIDAPLLQSNSGYFVFSNPFQFRTRFHITLNNDEKGSFEFLTKNKTFTLQRYGDKETISLIFTPQSNEKCSGSVVITTVDLNNPIKWTYPLVGTVFTSVATLRFHISGKADKKITKNIDLRLHGESEIGSLSKYLVELKFSKDDEWILPFISTKKLKIYEDSNQHFISIAIDFQPRRPIKTEGRIQVTNHIMQTWSYDLVINIESGDPCAQITFQSSLNKTESKRLEVVDNFKSVTQFHAYLLQGTSSEYTIVPADGFIAPTDQANIELPITVHFRPTIYGKKMHGFAVVDTIDRQYIFELNGKIPTYVPPVFVTTGRQDSSPSTSRVPRITKRKSIIKENTESARTPRNRPEPQKRRITVTPNTSRSPKY